jgi:hypothetical protein
VTVGSDHLGDSAAARLPDPETLLRETDWGALNHARGTAEDIPGALIALLDPDPAARSRALEHGLEPVRHQNSIYSATPPTALYVAAILSDPRTIAVGSYELMQRHQRERRQLPLRAALLDWLHLLALDANDECLAATRRYGFEDPHMESLRALRPALFHAVAEYLLDADVVVRRAALAAAMPLAEDPELAGYRSELIRLAEQLLVISTDHRFRASALGGLRAWQDNAQDLLTPGDIASLTTLDTWGSGHSGEPPF